MVAQRLRMRYQKARDLMLRGECGETWTEGNHLMAPETGVAEYERNRGARKVR
jgi:hypothetical protein